MGSYTALDRILNRDDVEILPNKPPGYCTIRECELRWGVSHRGAAYILDQGMKQGKVVAVKFRSSKNGWQWAYREANHKASKGHALATYKGRRGK